MQKLENQGRREAKKPQETCPKGMKIMALDKKYFLMGASSTKNHQRR